MEKDYMENMDKLVEYLNDVVNCQKIYIFGSYARGEQRKDSDIDIYITVKNVEGKKIDLIRKIRRFLLNKINVPMDILINTDEEFDKRKNIKSTLEYIVEKEGVKIYAKG